MPSPKKLHLPSQESLGSCHQPRLARGNASSCRIFCFSEITQGKTPLPCQGPKKMSETSTICFSRKGAHLLCSTYDFGREGRQGSKVCLCPYQFVCHSRRGKEDRSLWPPGISSRRPRISDPPCSQRPLLSAAQLLSRVARSWRSHDGKQQRETGRARQLGGEQQL